MTPPPSTASTLSQQTAHLDRRHAAREAGRRTEAPEAGEDRARTFAALFSERAGALASTDGLAGEGLRTVSTERGEGGGGASGTVDTGGLQSLAWWTGWTPSLPPTAEASAPSGARRDGMDGESSGEASGADAPMAATPASGRGARTGARHGGGASGTPGSASVDAEPMGEETEVRTRPGHRSERGGESARRDDATGADATARVDARTDLSKPSAAGEGPAGGPGGFALPERAVGEREGTPRGAAQDAFAPMSVWAASPRSVPDATAGALTTAAPARALLNTEEPGFAQTVALKVAQWSGEGVQQATLDLHPAELGPIRIRIDVEGREARIHFSAEHERTRAMLDEAVPALALALQSDGLSLAATRVTDGVKPLESLGATGVGAEDGRAGASGSAGDRGADASDPRGASPDGRSTDGRGAPLRSTSPRPGREDGADRDARQGSTSPSTGPVGPHRLSLDLYA